MSSLHPGFEYDIFISYRHKDNKGEQWVTEFVTALRTELDATFKEDVSIYFDENPIDGLLENHNVDKSLEVKLKCLIFIPILSQTYCDPKSFAWQHEFCVFNQSAIKDSIGRDIKLRNGNFASRILPVRIRDLDNDDTKLIELELGSSMRAIDFIFTSKGVNRPLTPTDRRDDNLNRSFYRDQINKVANAAKEIIGALMSPSAVETTERVNVNETSELEKSIAVLPFVNMSSDPEQDYFSDGLSEELLNVLARVKGLKVIARTSSFAFKGKNEDARLIGEKLNVSYLLEGSVRKFETSVRITCQLIRADNGVHLWSEAYDRQLLDILGLQIEIAEKVLNQLQLSILAPVGKAQLLDQDVYLLTLKGNYFASQYAEESFRKGIDCFSKAISKDPNYAPAYAGLAFAYLELGGWHTAASMDFVAEARKKASMAIKINDSLAEAHVVLARISFYEFNWSAAKIAFDKAIKLDPKVTGVRLLCSNFLTAMGRFDEAINFGKTSIEIDPLSAPTYLEVAWAYFHAGKLAESEFYYERGLEIEAHPMGLFGKAWLHVERGELADAKRLADETIRLAPHVTMLVSFAGYVIARAGFKDSALRILSNLREQEKVKYVSPFMFAFLCMGLEQHDIAIAELQKAVNTKDILLVWLKQFRVFDPIRSDSRFQEIMRQMNFPE